MGKSKKRKTKGANGADIPPARDSAKTVAQKEDEYLSHIVLLAPLVVSSIVATRFLVIPFNAPVFGSFVCMLGAANLYQQVVSQKKQVILWRTLFLLLVTALTVVVYVLVESPLLVFYLLLSSSLLYGLQTLPLTNARAIVVYSLGCVLEMGLLAFLGMGSQFPKDVLPQAMFLGIFPGLLLSGSHIARHADVLESAGYRRSFTVQGKKPEPYTRVGFISFWFSLFALIAPALCLSLPLYQILPSPFLWAVLPLMPVPGICSAFMEKKRSDEETARMVLRLALAMSVLMLGVGYMSVV